MITFLKALIAIPKIADILEKVCGLVLSLIADKRRKEASEKFDEAAKKAELEKDTCELDKMFDPSKNCDPK